MPEEFKIVPQSARGPRQEKLPLSWQPENANGAGPGSERDTQPKPAVAFALTPRSAPLRTLTPPRLPGDAAPVPLPATGPGHAAGTGDAAGIRPVAPPRPKLMGKTLREAREARQFTPAQLSQKTKIPVDFINKAEADQVEALPPPVYSKSYLRQLCREFNLDPEPLLNEYRAVHEPAPAAEGNAAAEPHSNTTQPEAGAKAGSRPRSPTEKANPMKKLSTPTIAVGLILGAVLVLVVLAAAIHRHGKKQAAATDAAVAAAPGAPAGVDLDRFITPQQLPMKELPIPNK